MKIGQKCVCVVDYFQKVSREDRPFIKAPIKREIYTIRDIVSSSIPGDKTIYVRLVEIVNPVLNYLIGHGEVTFDIDGFRPVDESFGEQVAEKLEVFFVPLEAAYKEQNHFGE